MVRDCPACGLVNPPTAIMCDCGYDFVNKRRQSVGRESGPGTFESMYLARLIFVAIVMGIGGIITISRGANEPDEGQMALKLAIGVGLVFGAVVAFIFLWRRANR